jgi:poly-gamma-glutamate capsule biosynthesis protein CapA/YwtB (metallophosphatase superfamily)
MLLPAFLKFTLNLIILKKQVIGQAFLEGLLTNPQFPSNFCSPICYNGADYSRLRKMGMSISRSERHQQQKQRKKQKRKAIVRIAGVLALFLAIGALIWSVANSSWLDTALNKEAPAPAETPHASQGSPEKPAAPESPPAEPVPPGKATAPGSATGNANTSPSVPRDSSPVVKLAFVGDVMWASTVETRLKENGFDYPYLKVKELLQKPDITVANLETPITTRGEPETKQYAYRSSPDGLPAFKEAGFDLVNLANNHILDYGLEGLTDTFDVLDRYDIKRVGAGRNAKEAFQPVIIEKNGVKVAFVGFSKVVPENGWKAGTEKPGVADTYATKVPVEAVKNARKAADLVIVLAHWGKERADQPEPYQIDFAKEYIDAGADLVVGAHPHVLQGFEQYKGKWIAYSLGNFIFTMNPNPVTWESAILEATCDKSGGCSLHVTPILTKLANPEPMNAEDGAKLFERLTTISRGAEVGADGTVRAQPVPPPNRK